MLYGNYRFNCRFETEARLPAYKGSTFRGVFGRALKQVVYTLTQGAYLLKTQLFFAMVFEIHLVEKPSQNVHMPADPQPSVIQPLRSKSTNKAKESGEMVRVGFVCLYQVKSTGEFCEKILCP